MKSFFSKYLAYQSHYKTFITFFVPPTTVRFDWQWKGWNWRKFKQKNCKKRPKSSTHLTFLEGNFCRGVGHRAALVPVQSKQKVTIYIMTLIQKVIKCKLLYGSTRVSKRKIGEIIKIFICNTSRLETTESFQLCQSVRQLA